MQFYSIIRVVTKAGVAFKQSKNYTFWVPPGQETITYEQTVIDKYFRFYMDYVYPQCIGCHVVLKLCAGYVDATESMLEIPIRNI